MIKRTEVASLSIGDEVKFFHRDKPMIGKIEDISLGTSPMDKVLVFAHPVDSPTTAHGYRIEMYKLKPAK